MTKQPKHIPNPNTIGRPPGSRNKRTIIREAMQKAYPGGEAGFWAAVVEQAKAGDLQAATMLADRLYPKLKPQGELLTLSEPLDGSSAQPSHQRWPIRRTSAPTSASMAVLGRCPYQPHYQHRLALTWRFRAAGDHAPVMGVLIGKYHGHGFCFLRCLFRHAINVPCG